MEFDLTSEQQRWQKTGREFAETVVQPCAEQLDREQKFPYSVVAQMADLGLLGLTVPQQYNGSGGDFISYCVALEEVSRADTSIGITMESHISLGMYPIMAFGSSEQKHKLLPDLAAGRKLWALGITEEGAGSDAGGVETTAEMRDGEWVINGSKRYITNSGTDITAGITALCRTGLRDNGKPELSTILVRQGTSGYTQGPPYEKLGWRAADQHPLYFRNCTVPGNSLLGERGKGLAQCLQTLERGRIAVAALSVGLAQACLDAALTHVRRRKQFGKLLSEFQVIQFKLADMDMEIELARTATLKAAWLASQDRPCGREASIAKVYASEVAKRAADQSLQIHGGEGFLEPSAVARYWRQVKINEIGEGTSEINRQIIARTLLTERDRYS